MNSLRFLTVVFMAWCFSASAMAQSPAWKWYEVDENKEVRVNLYLFWSQSCPQCGPAAEFVEQLKQRHPWLNVIKYETSQHPGNLALYQQMARSLNRPAGQTPAFFYCKQLEIGYVSYEQSGRRIEQGLIRWREALQKHFRPTTPVAALVFQLTLLTEVEPPPVGDELPDLPVELPPEPETVHVPGMGEVSATDVSLPAVTLALAFCDAFNPCAFFVLLLLLSMLVHGRSRARMLIVGGTFVAASGLMYFLFMSAWLNLFFVIGHLRMITLAAGLIAVLVGVLNVKDYFWLKAGPSLSIPESAKPSLFQRMARLINVKSLPALLIGSAALATVANLYELLCTAGFPMVYTRILTLRELPTTAYYGYLAMYNLIYVIPMAIIVLGFVLTLGTRKLSEREGRVLKLLSGVMMLALAGVLLLWPDLLHSAVGAFGTLVLAVGVTAVIVAVDYGRRPRPDGEPRPVAEGRSDRRTRSARPVVAAASGGR